MAGNDKQMQGYSFWSELIGDFHRDSFKFFIAFYLLSLCAHVSKCVCVCVLLLSPNPRQIKAIIKHKILKKERKKSDHVGCYVGLPV